MEYKINNVLASPIDARDFLAKLPLLKSLPLHVDLIPDVQEIENQYQTGSCTANAAASALEIAYKRAGQLKDFSRLFIYWFSRKLGNLTGDVGAYPRDMCKAVQQNGTCLEPTWDFNVTNVNTEPSAVAIEEAKQYPVLEYARITDPDIVTQIKTMVAAGIPVLTTIKLSKAFYTLGNEWKQHEWDPAVDPIGSHEVIIIGYDDTAQRFLAQNSWGNTWGDGGFFGIPYTRIGLDYNDTTKAGYEYWIFSKLPVAYVEADRKETDPHNTTIDTNKRSKTNIKVLLGIAGATLLYILYILSL